MLNKRLGDRPFVAGDYSIADMAIWPWVVGFKNFGQKLEDFPNLKTWFEDAVGKRPAVVKGKAVGAELRQTPGINTDEQRKVRSARQHRWCADQGKLPCRSVS